MLTGPQLSHSLPEVGGVEGLAAADLTAGGTPPFTDHADMAAVLKGEIELFIVNFPTEAVNSCHIVTSLSADCRRTCANNYTKTI